MFEVAESRVEEHSGRLRGVRIGKTRGSERKQSLIPSGGITGGYQLYYHWNRKNRGMNANGRGTVHEGVVKTFERGIKGKFCNYVRRSSFPQASMSDSRKLVKFIVSVNSHTMDIFT